MATIEPAQTQKQKRMLVEIGKAIDEYLNGKNAKVDTRSNGFVVLLFEMKSAGEGVNYLSNAERVTAVKALEFQLDRLKKSLTPQTGAA